MGKTAVFVLAVLQQMMPVANTVDTLVLCNNRELAFQICQEFLRLGKYLPDVKAKVFFGGIDYKQHKEMLAKETPNVVIGTPGRILQLAKEKHLNLKCLKRFILDECDKVLETLEMRRDVQNIFKMTPHEKQVMLFSATMSKETRPICRKFTQTPVEFYIDSESKLPLHGLKQYYLSIPEAQKNRKLNDLLDLLDFNQVIIFVSGVARCNQLNEVLLECNFPSIYIHGGLSQPERLARYSSFKEGKSRILVSTDIFARGVDFERVNVVINYDTPGTVEQYLHRVARSGRFGTKGLAITFVSSKSDSLVLEQVQTRFEVEVGVLPNEIDRSTYTSA